MSDESAEVAHSARMYDYLLGGSFNFGPDRAAAEAVVRAIPNAAATALANRTFLTRVVRHLAERGVRQFLDLGSGLPTAGAVHEVAGAIDPTTRVVYVDNDRTVVEMSRRMLADARPTEVLHADLRDPWAVLGSASLLDLSQPLGLLAVSVLHFVPDADDPVALLAAYRAELASGSFLGLTHLSAEHIPEEQAQRAAKVYANRTATPVTPRTREQTVALFAGFDLIDPGVVLVHRWRPDVVNGGHVTRDMYGGVGALR